MTIQTTDETRALEALELAERATPFCRRCGAPMVPVTRGNALWLECASVQRERSIVRRLFEAEHTRLAVADHAA